MCWGRLELNSAGSWSIEIWIGHPCTRVCRICRLLWTLTSLSFRVYYAFLTHLQSLCLPHLSFYSSPSEPWNRLAFICLNVTLWGEVGPGDEHAASAEPWEWMKAWQLSRMLTDELLSSVYQNEKPWGAHSGGGLGKAKNMPQSKQLDSCLLCFFTYTKAPESIWTLKTLKNKLHCKMYCITNP